MRLRDALISMASIGILIALLAITDDRVRGHFTELTPGLVSQQVAQGRGQIRNAGISTRRVIIDSGPLAVLVIAGTILFVGMLRT